MTLSASPSYSSSSSSSSSPFSPFSPFSSLFLMQRVADINVGDLISFKYLLQTLPIESTLQPTSGGKRSLKGTGSGFGYSGGRDGKVDDRGSNGRRSNSRSSSRGHHTVGNSSYSSPGKTKILFT
jgi:hypothetical protein